MRAPLLVPYILEMDMKKKYERSNYRKTQKVHTWSASPLKQIYSLPVKQVNQKPALK